MQHTPSKDAALTDQSDQPTDTDAATSRAPRLRPGERRVQILQALAAMLEAPKSEKITTAALAARLNVSEAALYRHFASKAQMFEGLIEFIEQTVFGLINQITAQEPNGVLQVRAIALMLLEFAQRNPGMTRVLTGTALVGEHVRLLERMNRLTERIEASLRQCLKLALTDEATGAAEAPGGTHAPLPAGYEPGVRANLVLSYVLGRWHRYAQSGFARVPTEAADAQLHIMLQ